MADLPGQVSEFLKGERMAVVGVSRDPGQPANLIFRRLRDSGHEVAPVNPNAAELEGATCYPDVLSVPGRIDGVVFAGPPGVAPEVVRHCKERSVPRVWFHRSIGRGSVSEEAVALCESLGIEPIVGGCPMMYCEPVDPAHRCLRWWLRLWRAVPG